MRSLPKHLRPRWRYLGVGLESWPDTELTREALASALDASARQLLGDATTAHLRLAIYEFWFEHGTGEAVVRTTRGRVEDTRAALACLQTHLDRPLGVHVRGVSGTVRGCEESYLGRRPEPTPESPVVFAGAERLAVRRRTDVDVTTPDGFVGATTIDLE